MQDLYTSWNCWKILDFFLPGKSLALSNLSVFGFHIKRKGTGDRVAGTQEYRGWEVYKCIGGRRGEGGVWGFQGR